MLRAGKTETLKGVLGRREDAEGAVPAAAPAPEAEAEEPKDLELLGMTLSTLTDELREQLSVGSKINGLAVTDVEETSEAYEKGLRAGDVITEAGQQKVETLDALESRIEEVKEAGHKSLLLLVRRAGDPRFVALRLDDE